MWPREGRLGNYSWGSGRKCLLTPIWRGLHVSFKSDEGNQFISEAFTTVLETNGIAISTDGKGSWHYNVFVERLRKSVKHEAVYLYAYDTVAEALSR